MYANLPVYIPDEIVNEVEEMAEKINISGCYMTGAEEDELRAQYIKALADRRLRDAAFCKAQINYIDSEHEHYKKALLEIQRRKEKEERDEREKQREKEAAERRQIEENYRQYLARIPWRPH